MERMSEIFPKGVFVFERESSESGANLGCPEDLLTELDKLLGAELRQRVNFKMDLAEIFEAGRLKLLESEFEKLDLFRRGADADTEKGSRIFQESKLERGRGSLGDLHR